MRRGPVAVIAMLAVHSPAWAQTVSVSGTAASPLSLAAGSTSNTNAVATVTITPSGTVTVRELRFANLGTSLPGSSSGSDLKTNQLGADIAALQLWADTNGSGALDGGDTVLANAAWSASRKRFVFSGLALVLSAPRNLFVTLGVGTGAVVNRTFALSLAAADVVLDAGSAGGSAAGRTITFSAGPSEGNAASGAPSVVIVNPGSAAVASPFRVQARVFDPDGLAGVTVTLSTDGGNTFPTTLARNASHSVGKNAAIYDLESTPSRGLTLAPGLYTLRARATDGVNVTLSGRVVVAVNRAGSGDGMLLVRDNSSRLCSDCHAVRTHSSDASRLAVQKYGAWGVGCRDCHTPHETTNAYLVKLRITPPAVNGSQGAKDVKFSRRTGDSGSTSVGAASYANADNSGPCQVCHTRTKDKLGNPRWRNTGNSDTTHYAAAGPNGTRDCTVCHSHSAGFAHGGGGIGCDECHGHDAAWLGNAKLGKGTYQSHSTHTENDADDRRGPFIPCIACHDTSFYPSFNSGVDADGDGRIDLAETDVCDGCHSAGGAYDGLGDAAIGAKVTWRTGVYAGTALAAGKERWCVGCHDGGTSVIPAGTGRAAPQVGGNGTTYGYYANGHGSRGTECVACHDLASNHNFDGKKTYVGALNNYRLGYRLKTVNGGDPLRVPNTIDTCTVTPSFYALCLSCHDPARLFADVRSQGVYGCSGNPYGNAPSIDTGFRNVHPGGVNGRDPHDLPANIHADHLLDVNTFSLHWYSDDEIKTGTPNSLISCPTCHDPHGDRKSDGNAAPKMTKGVYGVFFTTNAIGSYGQIGSREWYDDPQRKTCNIACHSPGTEKWFKDSVPYVRTTPSIRDVNPADPAAPCEVKDFMWTNARTVNVTLDAYSYGRPMEMQLAENASFSPATAWAPYSAGTTYTLTSPGEGRKTMYVRFRNAVGVSVPPNTLPPPKVAVTDNAAIYLDTVSPVVATTTLTSPNGGEVWSPASTQTITWSPAGATDANVRYLSLAYSTDDGASYTPISMSESNDGSYAWTVPNVHSATVRVRLTATDFGGNQASDTSDATFTIP